MTDRPIGAEQAKARAGNRFNIAAFLVLAAMLIVAALIKLVQYYGFLIHDWDTGIYTNIVWNLTTGDWFHSDVLNRNHLGEHFSPIVAIFAPFFFLAPSPIWLVAAQGLAIGMTYILLYFVALKIFGDTHARLRKPLALVFAIWAFFYRPLTSALLFEFHPSTLATPLLAGAILALLHRRDRALWLLVAVLLLSKENAPLAVLGLGCYAGLVLLRLRLGLALGAVAAVSAALIMGIAIPHFRSDDWGHYGRLGPLADWQNKSRYLLILVKGLAFLPLAYWRGLMCAAPLIALNLSVSYFPQYSGGYHYNDFASVFLLVAAMHGCVVVSRLVCSMLEGWRASAAHAVIALIAAVLAIPGSGKPISYLIESWPGADERRLWQDLAPYRNPASDFGVAAQQALGPYLSMRQRYVAIFSTAQNIDMRSLKPGDKVFITPVGDPDQFAELKRRFDKNALLATVHASSVLHVYQVLESGD